VPQVVDPLVLALALLVDPLVLALGDPARADRLLVLGVAVVVLGWALLRLALPAPRGARPR
jgi:hypothetical protein